MATAKLILVMYCDGGAKHSTALFSEGKAKKRRIKNMKTLKVKLTLTEPILGAVALDPEAYEKYIKPRGYSRLDGRNADDETELIENAAEAAEDGDRPAVTGFLRNADGQVIILDHVIRGFFKEACGILRINTKSASKKVTSYKKKIDGLVFIQERQIPLIFPEGKSADDIKINERPLRASTAQGERIALAASEELPEGMTLEFGIDILDNSLEKAVREWLNYGRRKGLGQWRNASYGRFTWEEISCEESDELF